MKRKMSRIKIFFHLHLLLCFLSLGSIFSKLAATENTFNANFILYYMMQLMILFVYAIFWQLIIKKLPLSTAYANRAITVFWGTLWGYLLFGETIGFNKVIGCVLIAFGILLFIRGNSYES